MTEPLTLKSGHDLISHAFEKATESLNGLNLADECERLAPLIREAVQKLMWTLTCQEWAQENPGLCSYTRTGGAVTPQEAAEEAAEDFRRFLRHEFHPDA